MHLTLPKLQLVHASNTPEWVNFVSRIESLRLHHEVVELNEWREQFPELPVLSIVFFDQKTLDQWTRIVAPHPDVIAVVPRNQEPPPHEVITQCRELLLWPCDDREIFLRMRRTALSLPGQSKPSYSPATCETFRQNLIGKSESFRKTIIQVEQVAPYDVTVLLEGETGTGKELVARALHYLSNRREGPFVPVNCGSIPESLFENQLFGHRKGAYTDARSDQYGLVARAESGTLFLDEIDTLSPHSQAAMLRFLEVHEFTPLGSQTSQKGDVRIIAATNAKLAERAESGDFRNDVLFRLDLLAIQIPPLRDRGDDPLLLAEHFLDVYARQHGLPRKQLTGAAKSWIAQHAWPGNVRELQNRIQKAVLLDEQSAFDLPGEKQETAVPVRSFADAKTRAIAEFEKQYLTRLMSRTKGDVTGAARIAGKERSAFGKLLKKHAIDWRTYRDSF